MTRETVEKIIVEVVMADDVGAELRKQISDRGLSHREIADKCGFSGSVISDYCSGRRKSIGVLLLRRIAEAIANSPPKPRPKPKLEAPVPQPKPIPPPPKKYVNPLLENAINRG